MIRIVCTNEHDLHRGGRGTVLSWHVLQEACEGAAPWTVAYAIVQWDVGNTISLASISDLTVLVQP